MKAAARQMRALPGGFHILKRGGAHESRHPLFSSHFSRKLRPAFCLKYPERGRVLDNASNIGHIDVTSKLWRPGGDGMRFKVYGPYNIGVEEGHANWIDKEDIKDFWEKRVVADNHKLPDACGVYLFGMRGLGKNGTAGKTLPWYVGKAEKQRFKTECFNFKNLYYFNSILINEYRGKGSPFLYLLARVEGEEFSPPASKEEFWGVRFVEEMFIQMSLSANSGLLNKSTTKMARETSIRGLLNTKKYKSASVDEFKGVLGINKERKPTDVAKYEETKFRYEVYGPYDVPIKNAAKVIDKAIDPEDVKQMWDELRNGGKGKGTIPLDACGVYVIGMRHGNNTTPWYVGTAYNSSFEKRCFESASEKTRSSKEKESQFSTFCRV